MNAPDPEELIERLDPEDRKRLEDAGRRLRESLDAVTRERTTDRPPSN